MNYHLMIDEKFIGNFIIDAEKVAPGNNVYLIASFKEDTKHVKSDKVIYAPYHSALFSETVKEIKGTDQVFIHWASDEAISFVLSLPEEIKVGLFFWGGDIVEIPYSIYKSSIYGPLSLKYFEKHEERPKVKWNPLKLKRLIRTLGNRYWRYNVNEQKILEIRRVFFKRLNYFFNSNIIDFDWVKAHYETSAIYKYFFYDVNPISDMDHSSNGGKIKDYKTILLGNSDSVPNNHLEMLEKLKKYKDEAVKLIIPLNYGNKKYGDLIEKKAISIFGSKVTTLRTFMKRDVYYEMLDTVDVAIMNHYRAQALGNVLALLYRGKKVYLNEVSSQYKLLKFGNVVIGNSAEIDELSFDELMQPLSVEIRDQNILKVNNLFRIEEKEAVLKQMLA